MNVLIDVSHIGSLAEGSSVNLTCSSTANPAAGRYTCTGGLPPAPYSRWPQDRSCLYPLWSGQTLDFIYVRQGTMWEKITLIKCCWRWRFQRVSPQTGRKRKGEWHDVGQVETQRSFLMKDICVSLTFPQYLTSIRYFFLVLNFKINLHFINKPVCRRLSLVIGEYDTYEWGSLLPFSHLILIYPGWEVSQHTLQHLVLCKLPTKFAV